MKKIWKIVIAVAVVAVCAVGITVGVLKFQSTEDYYRSHLDDITADSETVFLTIDCSSILNHREDLDPALDSEKYVPSDGMILPKTEYVLRKGDTAYQIFDRAVRHNRIAVEQDTFTESAEDVYVKSINQIGEGSCGAMSGWMFKVNGVIPEVGCGRLEIKDGDEIVFFYVCDYNELFS